MAVLSCSRVLVLGSVLLVLSVMSVSGVQKTGADNDLSELLKALLDKKAQKNDLEQLDHKNHDSSDDDDDDKKSSSDTNSAYERTEYIEEMIRYQQRENERAANGEDFFRSDDSEYIDGRAMNVLSASQQNDIINYHNDLRRKEGGSNMAILRYNPKLAHLAQQWAQRCRAEHGQPPFSANDVGWKDLGQSYALHSAKDWKPNDGVKAWFDEKKDFDYNSLGCRGVCGHYTALVWGDTTDIGCGIAFCPSISGFSNAHFLVCNYGPAGNWQGKKPFLKGPACTQCSSGQFFCNNGLCDKSCKSAGKTCECKADCKRGGTKTSDCKCNCKPGSIGPNCADACQDLDPKCGRNPGYPEPFCKMAGSFGETVLKSCPKLCGTCKVVRDSSSNDYILKKLMLEYLEGQMD